MISKVRIEPLKLMLPCSRLPRQVEVLHKQENVKLETNQSIHKCSLGRTAWHAVPTFSAMDIYLRLFKASDPVHMHGEGSAAYFISETWRIVWTSICSATVRHHWFKQHPQPLSSKQYRFHSQQSHRAEPYLMCCNQRKTSTCQMQAVNLGVTNESRPGTLQGIKKK